MAVDSLHELFEVLGRGDMDEIVGTAESASIEFKSAPYQLDTPRGRRDLCADVAAFANGMGGVILIGVRTERTEGTQEEVAQNVRGVTKGLVDADQIRALVRQHVHPLLQVDIRRYALSEEHRELVGVVVSAQAEHDRPFIVDRMANETEADLQHAVGWPTRHGPDTSWQPASRIQQLISNGLRGASQLSLSDPSESSAASGDAAEHLAMIMELDSWSNWGRFTIQGTPQTARQQIPDFFGTFASTVERWQGVRSSGFNLGLDYRPLQRTQRHLVAADDRRFVAISRRGVVTAAAVGSPDMLGWGNYPNERQLNHVIINPYVIVEFPSELVRFCAELVSPLISDPKWTYTVLGEQLQEPTPLHLRPRPASWGLSANRVALENFVSATVNSSGDQWRDAFEAVAEIYGSGYGLGRDVVPFAEGQRIKLRIMDVD